MCLEFPLGPCAGAFLLTEIRDDALVIFKLGLNVGKQTVGTVLTLAYNDHKVDQPFRLEHQPQRQENVEMGRFCMSSRPFEHRFQIRGVLDFQGSGIVERCIVDNAQSLARHLVAERQVMGKVIFAEGGVVGLQTAYAPVTFSR